MKENAVRNCSGVLCLCGCAGAPQVAICRGAWPGTVRRCVSDVLVLECVRKGVRYHPVLFGCVRKWYPPPPVCVPLPKPKIHPRNQPHRRQPHTHLKNYGRPRTVALPCHHWPRRAQALAARTWPRHEQHESLCHVNATMCGRVACANSQCDVAHVVLHTFRARACRHTTHANAI
jgi:hypothetical protein